MRLGGLRLGRPLSAIALAAGVVGVADASVSPPQSTSESSRVPRPIGGSAVQTVRYGGGGAIEIYGGSAGSRLRISYEAATNEVVIFDGAGAISYSQGNRAPDRHCIEASRTTVRCALPGNDLYLAPGTGGDSLVVNSFPGTGITAYMGAGADSVNLGPTGATGRIIGNAGDDELAGGSQRDLIGGGTGADRLDGRDGSDVLLGGVGSDSLRGGTGDDGLVARDTHEDRSISCGSGTDDARIDAKVDPEPKACETVNFEQGN